MQSRRCKNCNKKWIPSGRIPLWMNWCSEKCQESLAMKKLAKVRESNEKARAKELSKQRKENKKARTDLRSANLSHQKKITKRVAQTLANRLDAAKSCISCDRPRGSVLFAGGHYKPAGNHPEKALLIANIHGQCNFHCNKELSGNLNGDKNSKGMIEGILERYGQRHLDYLDSHIEKPNYTIDDLKSMRRAWSAEIRHLAAGNTPTKNWREIPKDFQIEI